MKKIYLSVLSFAVVLGANAQNKAYPKLETKKDYSTTTGAAASSQVNLEKATTIWSDEFDNAATWTVANTNTGGQAEEWSIVTDPSALPDAAGGTLTPLTSATAANGFAFINSDANNTGDNNGTQIISTIRTATAIDLTANPNVILEFAHNCRWWQESRIVRVSGDNGASWTDFTLTDFDGYEFGFGFVDQNTENPSVERINISAIAGGMASVLIEFEYNDDDQWGWYWAVDDVKILDQPLDDVVLMTPYIVGSTNEGIEYGYTPDTQLDATYDVGASVFNFGVNDQPTTAVAANFGVFSSNSTGLVESDSTRSIENTETLTLTAGNTYTGAYEITAGTDMTGGAEFGDNSGSRTFAVTSNGYAMDGIGVYPNPVTGSITTASFADAADNLIVGAQYHIKAAYTVTEIEVLLSDNTVEGGQMIAYIIDTASYFAATIGTPLGFSAGYAVTATDVANGYATLSLVSPTTLNPGAYFAAVELSSNTNTNDVGVVDDQTVAEPGTASMIIIPANATDPATLFSNGTAVGIRLNSVGLGLTENTLTGISIYPNPSNGVVTISNEKGTENTIAVYNMLGKEVYTSSASSDLTVDLSANGTGVYLVKVSNETGSMVERVVIK